MNIDRAAPVVTGMGIVSSIGIGCEKVQDALFRGRSGVRVDPVRVERGFRSPLTGIVTGFDSSRVLNRKQRKTLPEYGLWAWAALEEAVQMAGLEILSLRGDPYVGLVFGNDSSARTAVEQVDLLREAGETRSIGSGHIFRLLTSTITLNFNSILGIRGQCYTVSAACASGAMAVGQGADLIRRGEQRVVICGGAQEITWESMCSFDALGAFSSNIDRPQEASRPFDQARDGLVPSGGAAVVVLEEEEAARARGAKVLARVIGYGHCCDGHHVAVPNGEGLERSMRLALDDAGVDPAQVDLVLAHATSTPAGDKAEARAISRLFGTSPVVTAVKGLTGHEFWMAGASQLVYALLMARGGFASPNPNLRQKGPEAQGLDIPVEPRALRVGTVLLNAAGFGGTNASLVLRIS